MVFPALTGWANLCRAYGAGRALGSKFQWRFALTYGGGRRIVTELSGDLKKRHTALKVRCRQAESLSAEELK